MPRRSVSRRRGAGVSPALYLGGLVIFGGGAAVAWLLSRRETTVPSSPDSKTSPSRPPVPAPASRPAPAPRALASLGPRHPAPQGTWRTALQFDGTEIQRSGRLWSWDGDLSTDADGSPRAYHPDDWGPLRQVGPTGDVEPRAPKGLDAPENAVASRAYMSLKRWQDVPRWAGIATDDKGKPIIQGPNDPAPGYFVSTTSLGDKQFRSGDPRRYVDSEQIPYLAIPPELRAEGVRLGDLAVVEFGDVFAFAIVADVGPRQKIGEGSIRLVRDLGFEIKDARGGHSNKPGRGFRTYVWAGSGTGVPLSRADIIARATPLYEALRAGRSVA